MSWSHVSARPRPRPGGCPAPEAQDWRGYGALCRRASGAENGVVSSALPGDSTGDTQLAFQTLKQGISSEDFALLLPAPFIP